MYDKELIVDDNVAITVDRVSTNVLNVGENGNIGAGLPIYAQVKVTEAFTAGGAGTLTISLEVSDDDSTFVTLVSSPAIGKADLVAGAEAFRVVVPPQAKAFKYYRLNYVVGTGPMTAGKVLASLGRAVA